MTTKRVGFLSLVTDVRTACSREPSSEPGSWSSSQWHWVVGVPRMHVSASSNPTRGHSTDIEVERAISGDMEDRGERLLPGGLFSTPV